MLRVLINVTVDVYIILVNQVRRLRGCDLEFLPPLNTAPSPYACDQS